MNVASAPKYFAPQYANAIVYLTAVHRVETAALVAIPKVNSHPVLYISTLNRNDKVNMIDLPGQIYFCHTHPANPFDPPGASSNDWKSDRKGCEDAFTNVGPNWEDHDGGYGTYGDKPPPFNSPGRYGDINGN
jgi:hypothetical protein